MAALGCHETSDEKPAAGPQAVMGNGVIRGKVTFAGAPPVMRTIPNQPCHDGAKPIQDETVVVGKNGAMRNVLVYLKDASAVDGSNTQPALLDQVDCRYVPHVIGVQLNQVLRVRSSDPTLHNVHYDPSANAAGNFGLTRVDDERKVRFNRSEFIRVKCDVHPWMTAYIGVFENPFFAATGQSGEFEIKGLPAGTYTVAAWHELFGEQEQSVTVADGQAAEVTFEYKAP